MYRLRLTRGIWCMVCGRTHGCVLAYAGLCDYTTWQSPCVVHAHSHRAAGPSEQQLGRAVLKRIPAGTQLSAPAAMEFSQPL